MHISLKILKHSVLYMLTHEQCACVHVYTDIILFHMRLNPHIHSHQIDCEDINLLNFHILQVVL